MSQPDGLECSICFERFNIPKALPCQHTFCQSCVENLITHSYGNTVSCPDCRASHRKPSNGAAGFPTNFAMQRMLNATPLPGQTIHQENANMPYGNNTRRFHQPTPSPRYVRNTGQGNIRTVSSSVAFPFDVPGHRIQQQQDDLQLQLALQISEIDNIERGRGEDRNQRRRMSEVNSSCGIITKISQMEQRVVNAVLINHETLSTAFVIIFIHVTFSRFVAGAVKLPSDCELERRAAVYLFVKACLAVFFWGALSTWLCKGITTETLKNSFIAIYVLIDSLFSLIWLFVGTAWIFGSFNTIYSECKENDIKWNGHFINFALFLTVVDYIALAMFLLYTGYTLCDEED